MWVTFPMEPPILPPRAIESSKQPILRAPVMFSHLKTGPWPPCKAALAETYAGELRFKTLTIAITQFPVLGIVGFFVQQPVVLHCLSITPSDGCCGNSEYEHVTQALAV